MRHIDVTVGEVRSLPFSRRWLYFLLLHSALDAFKQNISPIIIDNTNTLSWEMKPYIAMVSHEPSSSHGMYP